MMYPYKLIGAGIFYSMDRLRKLKKIRIDPIEEKVSWMNSFNLDAEYHTRILQQGWKSLLH
jgi:hypothetical protein